MNNKCVMLAALVALAGLQRHSQADVILGSSSNFAVLAGAGITITGPTTITGDIGAFPTPSITGLENLTLNGKDHADDAITQQAKIDLVAAYSDVASRLVDATVATELGGTTRTPGVYDSASGTFGITGILKLDALSDSNAVFIFKMATTLTTAGSSQVQLINGAQANNVFWQVGSSATLGGASALEGNVLALTSIGLGTGATVDGRVLAENGAVTLDSNIITIPEPAAFWLLAFCAFGFRSWRRLAAWWR